MTILSSNCDKITYVPFGWDDTAIKSALSSAKRARLLCYYVDTDHNQFYRHLRRCQSSDMGVEMITAKGNHKLLVQRATRLGRSSDDIVKQIDKAHLELSKKEQSHRWTFTHHPMGEHDDNPPPFAVFAIENEQTRHAIIAPFIGARIIDDSPKFKVECEPITQPETDSRNCVYNQIIEELFEPYRANQGQFVPKVFIGHGHSSVWNLLDNFIKNTCKLHVLEFNRESPAGRMTIDHLFGLLYSADMAFLVMTAEDEQSDKRKHARMNVVHEVGLFQSRLGPSKAIVLRERCCESFSNIHGLGEIVLEQGRLTDKSKTEIREVLEREGLLRSPTRCETILGDLLRAFRKWARVSYGDHKPGQ